MALSLYRGVNTEEVLRVVTEGMVYLGDAAIRSEVGKSGISASRTRLGAEVMHYIADYPLWQAASQTGAQLLWRIPKNRKLPVLQRFKDGSYLSQITPAPAARKKMGDKAATAITVRQEFWGLLLAHHVVRKLMLEAALSRQRTPDVLSFKHSLTLIRRNLPTSGAIPPRALPKVVVGVG